MVGDVTPEPIMQIAQGFMAAKHLFTASAIGLFETLSDGPATLDEIAARSGIPRRTLRISADAMASLGLLQRDDDQGDGFAVAVSSERVKEDLRGPIGQVGRHHVPAVARAMLKPLLHDVCDGPHRGYIALPQNPPIRQRSIGQVARWSWPPAIAPALRAASRPSGP